ncbi:MAG: hypothetical protein H7039_13765 [Bryobacteraceae bacterium]|nr:hypothetical protein [Bryobacteraceae bacterium]
MESSGDWIHQFYSTADGLPSNTIRALLQDGKGYLWVGTTAGLARFDGVRFHVISPVEAGTTQSLSVSCLTSTPDGTLLAGVLGLGVLQYRSGIFTILDRKAGLPDLTVFTAHADRRGRVWLGITGKSGGLGYLEKGRYHAMPPVNGVKITSVRAIREAANGDLWVLTGRGLYVFHEDQVIRFFSTAEMQNQNLIGFYLRRDGVAWLTGALGLTEISDGKVRLLNDKAGLPDTMVWDIFRDRSDRVWVGTESGVFLGDGKRFQAFQDVEAFRSLVPQPMIEDREGNLWFGGSRQGGLHSLRRSKFRIVHREVQSTIATFLPATDGSLWIGTATHGLRYFSEGRWKLLSKASGLSTNSVYGLFEDSSGTLWISTSSAGVDRYRKGTVQNLSERDGLSNNMVFQVAEDRNHNFWIGTIMGVNFFDGKSISRFGLPGGTNMAEALLADREGNVWAGAYAGGVSRFRNGNFEKPAGQLSGGAETVHSLFQSSDGSVWSGTNNGLTRWLGDRLTAYGAKQGLPATAITSISEDDARRMWIGTGNGIHAYSLDAFNQVDKGAKKTLEGLSIGAEDGLPESEIIEIRKKANGMLLFASAHSLGELDPVRILRKETLVSPVIEGVVVDGVPSLPGTALRLAPDVRHVDFTFTAPSFDAPEKVAFRYRLAGLDSDWILSGTRRSASYTSLRPRDYVFEVQAANGDGLWNRNSTLLPFAMSAYFYQQPWFAVLSFLTFAAVLWTAYVLRIHQIQYRHQLVIAERTRIARDLHDTLLQGFSGAIWQLDATAKKVESAPASARAELESILRQMDASVIEARESIASIRLPKRSGESLLARVRELASGIVRDPAVSVEIRETGVASELDTSVEEEVYAVIGEALRNSVKHSGAQRIEVNIEWSSSGLSVQVSDDGCGFEPSAHPRKGHFGIQGMQERMRTAGGTLEIQGQPQKGTSVQLRVPQTQFASGAK